MTITTDRPTIGARVEFHGVRGTVTDEMTVDLTTGTGVLLGVDVDHDTRAGILATDPALTVVDTFTCRCGEAEHDVTEPPQGDVSTWCECGRRVADEREHFTTL